MASYGNSTDFFFSRQNRAFNFFSYLCFDELEGERSHGCHVVCVCVCVRACVCVSLSFSLSLSLSLSLSRSLARSLSLFLSVCAPVLDKLEEGGTHGGHDIQAAHPQPEHKQEKGPVVAVSYTLYVSLL